VGILVIVRAGFLGVLPSGAAPSTATPA